MSRNSKKLNPESNPDYVENNTQEAQKPEPPPRTAQNPFGLSFVVPTETVELPSAGAYYPVSSPLHGVKSVEIKHMTAKEEDILSSNAPNEQDLFDRLIGSILVENTIKPEMFLEEDKLAILLRARATGYGNTYRTTAFCENCKKRTDHDFDLTKVSINKPAQEDAYNPDINTFTHNLPVSDIVVELDNFTAEHEKELEEEKSKKEKYNLPFNYTVTFLEKMIVSANSVSDPSMIKKLIEVLPAADAKSIVEFFKTCRPTLSTLQEVECGECKTVTEREVPLSWAFFRIDV